MTDRELLELAAKAAGIVQSKGSLRSDLGILIDYAPCTSTYVSCHVWNPLADDGDALRLAVKLRLDIHYEEQGFMGEIVEIFYSRDEDTGSCKCETHSLGDDPAAATRLAIVQAAAAIGRAP